MLELVHAFADHLSAWCCEADSGPFPTWGEFLALVADDPERFGDRLSRRAASLV